MSLDFETMPNWEEMHHEGNRPWDLKGVTPMLKYFIESDEWRT